MSHPTESTSSSDRFTRATTDARNAIGAARVTQESTRATRCRSRLQGLIMSWRGRRTEERAVQSERLTLILDVVREEAAASMGNIQLIEDGALRIAASSGLGAAFLDHFSTVLPGQAACGTALKTGRPVVMENIAENPAFQPEDRKALLAAGVHACQSLALVSAVGPIGVISLLYRERDIPLERQAALTGLSADIAEAVQLAICRERGGAAPALSPGVGRAGRARG